MLLSSSKPGFELINHQPCVHCHVCECVEHGGGGATQRVQVNAAVTAYA